MTFKIPPNRRLARQLGEPATRFFELGVNALTRILPHAVASDWRISEYEPSHTQWVTAAHRQLAVTIGIRAAGGHSVKCTLSRKVARGGVGAIQRTLSPREREICETIVTQLSDTFANAVPSAETITALSDTFDETVVARHLKKHHNIALDHGVMLSSLRTLAEQTYENRSLSFGCVIDASRQQLPAPNARFPADYLARKRFRALSDAYYTAYLVSGLGAVIGFLDLPGLVADTRVAPRNYFPAWCRDLALYSRNRRLGMALTRNGDILVFDGASLRFTCRIGRWQYWNHSHLVDLLRNCVRVQHVPVTIIPEVVTAIYRAALDVSFRRTGGMFVILRNEARLSHVGSCR